MRELRAVVYGVGAMGSVATRYMLDKGVTIVGAVARSPRKVGADLGEVAGLDRRLGVTVEDSAAAVFSSRPVDIAVICVASYMTDMREHLRVCAENGVNAITISEECLYPWNTSPEDTARLDEIAKQHGVTITGSGHQDAYWVNLISGWMGTAHRIDSVTGNASWNVDDYGPEVAHDQRVGDSPEDFQRWIDEADRPPSFGRNTLGAIAADVGLTVTSMKTTTRPVVCEKPMRSQGLGIEVPAGSVTGFTDVDTFTTAEGPVLSFEMTGRLYEEGEADINDWVIAGEPNLRLLNPAVPTGVTTVTQLVNRIPDVINAEPGFVTIEKLPKLKYRAFPLATYLTG
jgi:2,4-diaminopentanoate dehydrogenase